VTVRILHVHSTFSLGGKEARAVRLMNAWRGSARHTVLSAVPDALGARDAIDPTIAVDFPDDHPPIVGKPAIGRYRELSRYMRQFDLVLTYNWGAMDAVGAHRLFGGPPLVHHEDGFNQDEAEGQRPLRVWFRRLVLGAAYKVVVPSATLEQIALTSWRQPHERVIRIPNGVPLARYNQPNKYDIIPGFKKQPDRVVIGTIAGLRKVKNLPRLVRAVAAAGTGTDLVIVGEGAERNAIVRESSDCQIHGRTYLPGFMSDPYLFVGQFDIFALSSDSEQQPISLIEAMAAGLPAVATDVGDIRHMVAEENLPFIIPKEDETAFATALATLAENGPLRKQIGAANQSKALQMFGESAMIDRYRALYEQALGRSDALN
jgi:glycosyltransferase involved in cell wall biosynthesis